MHDPLTADLTEFTHELERAVDDVRFDRMTRLLYSTDASLYQMMPVGVASPRDADEISGAIEIAARHGVPVLPRGGGSSLAGQCVNHALVLDVSRYMDRHIHIDPVARTATAAPGVTLGRLNAAARQHGLTFGPDPASGDRATVGGSLGNNATGAHSIRYGMSADHIISIDAVMADGSRARFEAFDAAEWDGRAKRAGLEGAFYGGVKRALEEHASAIRKRYPQTWRHVAGYNLNRLLDAEHPNLAELLVGAEGSLAMTTSATVRLVPLKRFRRLVLVHFETMAEALEAVPGMLETNPAALELLDKMLLDLARGKLDTGGMLGVIVDDPAAVLIAEYDGDSEAGIAAMADGLRRHLRRAGHRGAVVDVTDSLQQAQVWHTRKMGLGILSSAPGEAKPIPFIEDAAVPVDYLAEYVSRVETITREAGVPGMTIYAHASAGCLHIRPLINLKTGHGMRQMRAIAEAVVDVLVALGGTTSGEHGEGIARGEFSERLFGRELVSAFESVKAAVDPHNLMNPGKVVHVPRMDDADLLRTSPQSNTPQAPASTLFAFQPHTGFEAAVEMCNGAGVCRKLDGGVMCPSYRVTREEAHSTRGRANALRAAMQGRLGEDGMTSKDLYDVLDLCLSCKACKSECPSAVDMARMKADFLHGYHQAHGVPTRSWVFGHIAGLLNLGQPFGPVANLGMTVGGPLMKWALDVHPNRNLPRFTPQPFSSWFRTHGTPTGDDRREVVLYHDTFMEHIEPGPGRAVAALLEAAGFRVRIIEKHACCGRPAVSKGLLDHARNLAEANLHTLLPYARQGIPIIGVEPSCVTMFLDEYRDLLPGDDAETVAAQVFSWDAFLWHEIEAGRASLDLSPAAEPILVHGHCQQKAVLGIEPMMALLGLIPGADVQMIDSSCCGMAGSFGYESEHYDLSLAAAELALAPAVRAATTGTHIAAPGTSCREQIEHATDRDAVHPAEVLAAYLKN